MSAGPHIFGVRHLSPGASFHLLRLLEDVKPTCVLIEGPVEATELIEPLMDAKTVPPVGILAYTETVPVQTVVFPLARYCPEYQAARWAFEHKAEVRFIDLPAEISFGIEAEAREAKIAKLEAEPPEAPSELGAPEEATEAEIPEEEPVEYANLYERFAKQAGEPDYDTFWERRFEHNPNPGSYQQAAYAFGVGLRAMEDTPDIARHELREAHMRAELRRAEAAHDKARIVVVVGAFHASVLGPELPELTEKAKKRLPKRPTKLTLMPYSNFRLSSQSGYGAGNRAPAYFEGLWDALREDRLAGYAAEYLSKVARRVRKESAGRSTAEVIEAVRLAKSLTALRGGQEPTLTELHEAATTLLGQGELAPIAEALAAEDVGTAVGSLPEGLAQTSIQEDFTRQLKELKLEKYRTPVAEQLDLDLRENRFVKSRAIAFRDRSRSFFLHRLAVLSVNFGEETQVEAAHKERWSLSWTPEIEICLVEAVMLGETVELACAHELKRRHDDAKSVDEAARLVNLACLCGMPKALLYAKSKLQELGAESSDLVALAKACAELSAVVRYGSVRDIDTEALSPLLAELFLQASLSLISASGCDEAQAKVVAGAIQTLEKVAGDHHELVDEAQWEQELSALYQADHLNPTLSGLACVIALERKLLGAEALGVEVSRRLSPGIDADIGAAWFEGLAMKNHYSLLSRHELWAQLDGYVASMDEEEFLRAVVFLRRAFGAFTNQEKATVADNLSEAWGLAGQQLEEAMLAPLTEEQEATLGALDDFDFDDL